MLYAVVYAKHPRNVPNDDDDGRENCVRKIDLGWKNIFHSRRTKFLDGEPMDAANKGLIYDAIIADNKCRLAEIAQVSNKMLRVSIEENLIFHFRSCGESSMQLNRLEPMRTSPYVAIKNAFSGEFPRVCEI